MVVQKKHIIWPVIIGAFLCFMYLGVRMMAPGSYVYAETFEFNVAEDKLIKSLEDLKKNNPQFVVPIKDLTDGRSGNDYYYRFYFHYQKENQIVCFWTRPLTKEITTLGFVSICNDDQSHSRRIEINKDLSRKENKEAIKKFKEIILNNLGYKFKDKGNSMSLW